MPVAANPSSSPIRFTPRSVLMALDSQPKAAKKEKRKSKKGATKGVEGSKEMVLSGGDAAARGKGKGREVLVRAIAGFLESNGFKKTLAVFQSEAQLEDNCWKSSVVDLNDFTAKWLDASDALSVPAIEGGKTQDDQQQQETKEKKKDKKKKKESIPSENGNVKKEENASLGEMKPIEGEKEKKKRKESENEETETGENATKQKDKEGKKSKKKEKQTQENEEKEKVTDKETNVENEVKTVSKKRKKGEEENGEMENQSAEPKSVNAFKRVKVEEVKFVDDRLQDNSYWAKGGADSGYGAKAQQILEQVRGRDFRHEKTKKKRGTYRGGQIDLQSHSIKFNYSDEE